MDWLNIRLNRKRFLGLIIVFVAIFNFLQRSLGQTYIDNFHIFIGIWLAILLVLTKWRSNDIGMENKEFLLEFVIMFIRNSSAYSFAKHGKQAENPSVFSAYLENIFFIFSSISDPVRRMV